MALFNVRNAVACWVGVALAEFTSGCSHRDPTPAVEPVSTAESELSESGIERVIPIHFVLMKSSESSTNKLTADEMQRMVRDANFTFRPAGIQFYISAVDEKTTPSLADLYYDLPGDMNPSPTHPPVTWSAVVNDIQKLLPNAPTTLTSPSSTTTMHKFQWLHLASSTWGPTDELFVMVGEHGRNAEGLFPWVGRGMASGRDVLSPTGTFCHELGHYFGLPHNWQIAPGAAPDPETGSSITMDDYWDLIYGYEATPRFFANRDEAVAYTGTKRTKDKSDANGNEAGSCTANGPTECTVTCNLDKTGGGTFPVKTGEPGSEGISFTFAGDNPPSSYARGVNIMVYFGCEYHDERDNTSRYFGISKSQARMIRKYLRFRMTQASGSLYVANGTPQPTYRDLLGKYTGNQSLSYKLDFDGDGKRDIAVFRPPSDAVAGHTGQFFILKSSQNYAMNQMTTVNFGTIGDVPVPADYDGDGKTDIAVWRTMGPNGTDPTNANGLWLWCASSNNATCATAPTPVNWGVRSDIPLPGTDFDGNAATGELAVYRPSTSTFFWIKSPFTVGAWTSFTTAEPAAVPIVGLFDSDNQTDVVVYSPSTTTFSYLLSGSGWGVEGSRTFGLGPAASGGPSSQRAPFPVTTYTTGGKQVFSVWDPNSGVYHTMWNSLTSSTDSTCTWGVPSDIPVGTSIDRNNDGRSDRLIRRNQTNSGNVTYYFDSASQSCGTSSLLRTVSGMSQRAMLFSTMDSTGDGKPDLWSFDPDTMVWGYLTSESDFLNGVGPFQFGAPKDLPL